MTTYAPCRGCPDRCVGCHAGCDRYLAWRKPIDERLRRERIAQICGEIIADGVQRQIRQGSRKKRRKK